MQASEFVPSAEEQIFKVNTQMNQQEKEWHLQAVSKVVLFADEVKFARMCWS